MSDDQVGCEWVSVSSRTGLPGLSRTKADKRLCVCVCRHVSIMRHCFKYADRINTKYVAEIFWNRLQLHIAKSDIIRVTKAHPWTHMVAVTMCVYGVSSGYTVGPTLKMVVVGCSCLCQRRPSCNRSVPQWCGRFCDADPLWRPSCNQALGQN